MRSIKSLSKGKQRAVYNKLSNARKVVSKEWFKYRKKKLTIKGRYKKKGTIKEKTKELLKRTREYISTDWNEYREKKYFIVYKEKFKDKNLKLLSTKIYKKKRAEFFESVKNIENINNDILYIFKNKKVEYVLIDFIFKHQETGRIRLTSDSYTKEGFERIKDKDLFEEAMIKLRQQIKEGTTDPIEGYKYIGYTIRVVYNK